MITYQEIVEHHAENIYKKGRFKGDAPMDKYRRPKTWFRVLKLRDGVYAVRFHRTDIATFYPNGTVVLNANGYEMHPTTREAFGYLGLSIRTLTRNGYKNVAVLFWDGNLMHPFVSGMTYNTFTKEVKHPFGNTPKLKKYVADRAARKQLREVVNTQLKPVLPLLMATTESVPWNAFATTRGFVEYKLKHSPIEFVSNPEHWADIVEVAKYLKHDTVEKVCKYVTSLGIESLNLIEEI